MDRAWREDEAESPDEDRPGDAACWLRWVCQQCGTLADEDPPTICPHCQASIPDQVSP
jgi:rubrerythrin